VWQQCRPVSLLSSVAKGLEVYVVVSYTPLYPISPRRRKIAINVPLVCPHMPSSSPVCSQSGKSTFTRQMKLIFASGFSDSELEMYKEAVVASVVLGLQACIEHCQAQKVELGGGSLKDFFLNELPWGTRTADELTTMFRNVRSSIAVGFAF